MLARQTRKIRTFMMMKCGCVYACGRSSFILISELNSEAITLFRNFNCTFVPPTFLYKMKAFTIAMSRCCNTTLRYHFSVFRIYVAVDGVVVRASASQSVDLGFIPLVESYQKTLKNGIHSFPAWRSAHKG